MLPALSLSPALSGTEVALTVKSPLLRSSTREGAEPKAPKQEEETAAGFRTENEVETPLEEARSRDLEEEEEEREIGLNLEREGAGLRGLERDTEGEKVKAVLCIFRLEAKRKEMEIWIAGKRKKVKESEGKKGGRKELGSPPSCGEVGGIKSAS